MPLNFVSDLPQTRTGAGRTSPLSELGPELAANPGQWADVTELAAKTFNPARVASMKGLGERYEGTTRTENGEKKVYLRYMTDEQFAEAQKKAQEKAARQAEQAAKAAEAGTVDTEAQNAAADAIAAVTEDQAPDFAAEDESAKPARRR